MTTTLRENIEPEVTTALQVTTPTEDAAVDESDKEPSNDDTAEPAAAEQHLPDLAGGRLGAEDPLYICIAVLVALCFGVAFGVWSNSAENVGPEEDGTSERASWFPRLELFLIGFCGSVLFFSSCVLKLFEFFKGFFSDSSGNQINRDGENTSAY